MIELLKNFKSKNNFLISDKTFYKKNIFGEEHSSIDKIFSGKTFEEIYYFDSNDKYSDYMFSNIIMDIMKSNIEYNIVIDCDNMNMIMNNISLIQIINNKNINIMIITNSIDKKYIKHFDYLFLKDNYESQNLYGIVGDMDIVLESRISEELDYKNNVVVVNIIKKSLLQFELSDLNKEDGSKEILKSDNILKEKYEDYINALSKSKNIEELYNNWNKLDEKYINENNEDYINALSKSKNTEESYNNWNKLDEKYINENNDPDFFDTPYENIHYELPNIQKNKSESIINYAENIINDTINGILDFFNFRNNLNKEDDIQNNDKKESLDKSDECQYKSFEQSDIKNSLQSENFDINDNLSEHQCEIKRKKNKFSLFSNFSNLFSELFEFQSRDFNTTSKIIEADKEKNTDLFREIIENQKYIIKQNEEIILLLKNNKSKDNCTEKYNIKDFSFDDLYDNPKILILADIDDKTKLAKKIKENMNDRFFIVFNSSNSYDKNKNTYVYDKYDDNIVSNILDKNVGCDNIGILIDSVGGFNKNTLEHNNFYDIMNTCNTYVNRCVSMILTLIPKNVDSISIKIRDKFDYIFISKDIDTNILKKIYYRFVDFKYQEICSFEDFNSIYQYINKKYDFMIVKNGKEFLTLKDKL